MKPIKRVLLYLRYFPLQISLNAIFNLLHVAFSLGSYVLIVPFVELMFGLNGVPDVEPEFAFNQRQMVDWAFGNSTSTRQSKVFGGVCLSLRLATFHVRS